MNLPSQPEAPGLAAATGMFIEVLVIGIGSLASLFGLGVAVIGYDATEKVMPIAGSTPFAGLAVAFAYALGILIDRCADFLLKFKRRSLRARYFSSNSSYAAARRSVNQFPDIVARADYARSRMRICRGWFLNCILLLVSANLVLIRFPVQNRSILLSATTMLGLLVTVGFYIAWSSITLTSYKKLQQQAQIPGSSVPSGQNGAPDGTGAAAP
ncbi:hypothetical protein ACFWM0_31835 [Streptomyces sp. NPDC058405]|uniref:hypothetical protein n=1 Tax=Streptomyces sp. NPDC058405 TaxID=3346482 RepID=UPI00366617F7